MSHSNTAIIFKNNERSIRERKGILCSLLRYVRIRFEINEYLDLLIFFIKRYYTLRKNELRSRIVTFSSTRIN